jgi:hypothetical protein
MTPQKRSGLDCVRGLEAVIVCSGSGIDPSEYEILIPRQGSPVAQTRLGGEGGDLGDGEFPAVEPCLRGGLAAADNSLTNVPGSVA